MSESPLNDPALLATLSGIIGVVGGILLWIYNHTRTCHRGPTKEQAEAAENEAAENAAKAAHIDAEIERLSKEIGHAGTKGTILWRQHWASKRIRRLFEALGMNHEREHDE